MKHIQQSRGCYPNTEMFFHTSSEAAKQYYYFLDVCGHTFASPGYRRERQTYNDYILIYVVNGQLDIVNEGIPYVVYPGQAVLMNCHQPHVYATDYDTEMWYLHFDHVGMAEFYPYIKDSVGIIVDAPNEAMIAEHIKLLVSYCKHSRQISEVRISQMIYTILSSFIYAGETGAKISRHDNELVNQVIEYIQAHYSDPISLEHLAAIHHVSSYYLSHLFKRCTQHSPYDYIILTRLDRAKELLNNSKKSVSEIAQIVGYTSDTGFINAFTKKIGVSPGKFRTHRNV